MLAWLQEQADETFGAENNPAPFDYVLSHVEQGGTITNLATEISDHTGVEIKRAFLDKWCREHPRATERIAAARALGAGAMVERGMEIVDGAEKDRDAIRKAQMQADYRLKVAGKLNRAEWGEAAKGVQVNLNFGDLHLLAHRQVGQAAQAQIEEAEVISIGPGEIEAQAGA